MAGEIGIGVKVAEAVILLLVTSGGFGFSIGLMKRYLTDTETRIKSDLGEIQQSNVATEARIKKNLELIQQGNVTTMAQIQKDLGEIRLENENDHREILKYSKAAVKDIKLEVDDLYEKHHKCREELPKSYADKEGVEKLWQKADKLADDLSFMKGKQNGMAKSA